MQSKPLEFAPTISALDVGLKSDDLEGQLEYVKNNKAEIKQRMVDCGAGELWRTRDSLMKRFAPWKACY